MGQCYPVLASFKGVTGLIALTIITLPKALDHLAF